MERRAKKLSVAVLVVSLLAAACSSDPAEVSATDPPASTAATTSPGGESVTVLPDYDSDVFVVNVNLTDEGFSPETVFMPAGRHVKLVLRNHGRYEHHYRVKGLVATEIQWLVVPEVNEDELLASEQEGGFVSDIEHILHHLTPEFVPFKEASRSGIRPLATELHGYTHVSGKDVLMFYPLNTGSFVVEDVLYPEITGKVVVFDPGV